MEKLELENENPWWAIVILVAILSLILVIGWLSTELIGGVLEYNLEGDKVETWTK